ncbi:hypothetical protein QF032_002438 [Streptomyces achromogenes]|nr:hypothetical protein [Streptomyces achromogenes]
MSVGLPLDLKVMAEGMTKASMGMVGTVMVGTRDTAIALFHELDRQHGMAGDDDAGRAFAAVYKSAASTTLEVGFSASSRRNTSATRTARSAAFAVSSGSTRHWQSP